MFDVTTEQVTESPNPLSSILGVSKNFDLMVVLEERPWEESLLFITKNPE